MDYHAASAAIASLLSIACFIPYLRDIFRGTTKPHPYTWIVWALLQAIVVGAMWRAGAGLAVAPMAIGAALCLFIFVLSLRYGTKNITAFDAVCLGGAFVAGAAYVVFANPLASVVLATGTDALGFLPTLRKVIAEPVTETASTHLMSGTANGFAIGALARFTAVTLLYLSVIMVLDFLCGFLALRGRGAGRSRSA